MNMDTDCMAMVASWALSPLRYACITLKSYAQGKLC